MKTLSNAAVTEFNSLNSRRPILLLAELDITISGTKTTHYLVNNNEDIVWGSNTYSAFPFTFDVIPSKSADTLPEVNLEMMNLSGMLEYLESADSKGLIGYRVVLYIVYATETAGVWAINTDDLPYADYPLRYAYIITKTSVSKTAISMTLGVPNYFQRPFPARLYRRDWCDFAYKGDLCWMKDYTPAITDSCDHSYTNCKLHHASQSLSYTGVRFGGFPNLGKGSYKY